MNKKLYDSLMSMCKRSYPEYAFPEQYPRGQEAYMRTTYRPVVEVGEAGEEDELQPESLQSTWDKNPECILCKFDREGKCIVNGTRWRGIRKTACEACQKARTRCWAEGEEEMYLENYPEKAGKAHNIAMGNLKKHVDQRHETRVTRVRSGKMRHDDKSTYRRMSADDIPTENETEDPCNELATS